jgi:hypothetical protein
MLSLKQVLESLTVSVEADIVSAPSQVRFSRFRSHASRPSSCCHCVSRILAFRSASAYVTTAALIYVIPFHHNIDVSHRLWRIV